MADSPLTPHRGKRTGDTDLTMRLLGLQTEDEQQQAVIEFAKERGFKSDPKGTVPLPDHRGKNHLGGSPDDVAYAFHGGEPSPTTPDSPFLQALRPQDVSHIRNQLVRWWSHPGQWQHQFALQGRNKIEGWSGNRTHEAEDARWWMEETFRRSELYWVSPEMTEVISTLASTIPDCTPQPPVPDAFVMFAKSVPGTDAENGDTIYTSAMLWGTATLYRIGAVIACETYAWRDLVGLYRGLTPDMQDRFREIYPNRLMPTGGSEWPLGTMASEFRTVPPYESETQKTSIVEDRKLLATFWALCSQRIVVETVERPGGRAAMRQAQREGRKLDEVRVIRLREPTTRTSSGEGGPVEWSHRWLVGRHWRNQWYPSKGEHAPKLIEAYQKGPADKPLVIRETVRALMR